MPRYLPLAPGTFTISSGYGMRDGQMHQGLDYAAPKGTPIYAPLDGVVIEGTDRANVVGFGRWVWLDCQRAAGLDIIIGHCDPAVRGGDIVRAGQIIAYVNSHGKSTGPHAHVELWAPPGRVGGTAIDPGPWFAVAVDPRTAVKGAPSVDSPITRTQISPNKHSGGRDVDWIAIHTQEGSGDILGYLCNPASEVSYNAVVTDRDSILVVPWDENPWSASNANQRADHILLAGSYASWSRGKWLETDRADGVDEDAMLTRAAALTAWRCLEHDIPIEYVGGGKVPPDRPGIVGHVDFGAWGGGHHDPGPHFPWDEFIRRARAIAKGDDMPSLDEIAKAVWGHRLRKPGAREGQNIDGVDNETAGNMLAWDDLHSGVAVNQLGGDHSAARRDGSVTGWEQLGGRSIVDALAVIGEHLGLDGFKAPKNGGKS
uniref:peptidoglycan DD-metalloendopeptidase family protein n=1 Tax=Micromonospora sp. NBC_00855 TaxID=2975978 RepID=UPI002258DCFA